MKVCRECKTEKENENFRVDNKKTGNRETICRKCDSLRAKKWAKENPEKRNIIRRRWRGNYCMICGSQPLLFSQKVCSHKCLIISKSKKLENGCWEWQGIFGNSGYGKSCGSGRGAHRVSYEAFKGTIAEKMQVMHSCDNKKCVNPEHLSLGSPKENIRDYIRKYGSWNPKKNTTYAKYSDEHTKIAWELRKKGHSWGQMGFLMEIPPMTAKYLCKRYQEMNVSI